MNRTWWRSLSELDGDQRAFVELPVDGRYQLIGPPGSGKTNLLLLRAQYFAGRGDKNILFVTFSRELAGFIQTGIARRSLITPDQVTTYWSWALNHVREHGGAQSLPSRDASFEERRVQMLEALRAVRGNLPTTRLYDGIFVDEAQDLSVEELRVLLELSDRVCISGDRKQGIYQRDGLDAGEALGLDVHHLRAHFRIGPKIARVADKLLPPASAGISLEGSSNYDASKFGESSAIMYACVDRDEQFRRLVDEVAIQLDAFPGEDIGIFCPRHESLDELGDRLAQSVLAGKVTLHGRVGGAGFGDTNPIHVLTVHSAKGTEFRAVHIFAAEELTSFPLNRRTLSYTAVTRAKTALRLYHTGGTTQALESALTDPDDYDWTNLFEDSDG
jgi:superfamily I DNA/RNA helicase